MVCTQEQALAGSANGQATGLQRFSFSTKVTTMTQGHGPAYPPSSIEGQSQVRLVHVFISSHTLLHSTYASVVSKHACGAPVRALRIPGRTCFDIARIFCLSYYTVHSRKPIAQRTILLLPPVMGVVRQLPVDHSFELEARAPVTRRPSHRLAIPLLV